MRSSILRGLARLLRCHHLLDEVSTPFTEPEIKKLQRNKITSLLSYVNKEVPYFQDHFSSFLNSTAEVSDDAFFKAYTKLPTFSKQDYVLAGKKIHSEKITSSTKELQFEKAITSGFWNLRQGNVHLNMATGGSSKMPLSVRMDKEHLLRLFFSFFRCWRHMDWQLGDKTLIFYPAGTYNIDDLQVFNNFSWLFGFKLLLFNVIDEKTTRILVEEMTSFQPKLLMTFPSPLNLVSQLMKRHQIKLSYVPPLINVSGETFLDCQRENINSVFTDTTVSDSYGSVEFGEIAHETEEGFEIFSDIAYVETVAHNSGQEELVVTMLGLKEYPFIRYRIGDIAQVTTIKEKQFLTAIEGKSENCLRRKDNAFLYPSALNQLVNELNQQFNGTIVEVKLIKRGENDIELKFITFDDEPDDTLAEVAKDKLQKLVGTVDCSVKFVLSMEHDYRRKYRVIEEEGAEEYVGGVLS